MASSNLSNYGTVCQYLEDQLKCEICGSGPKFRRTNWYRCMGLHHICEDCKEIEGKTKCSCGQRISHAFDKMTETYLKAKMMKSKFKCENVERGCNEEFLGQDMDYHQEECIYRLVFCPSGAGFEHQIVYHQLLEHMEEFPCYSAEFKLSGKVEVDSLGPDIANSRKVSKIEHDGRVFFLYRVVNDDKFTQGIFFYGSYREAKKYVYTIEYYGVGETHDEGRPNSKLMFQENVHSVDVSITRSLGCIGVDHDFFFLGFCYGDNNNFKSKVTIRNLKDDNAESGVSETD